MSRPELVRWIAAHWWQISAGLLAVGMWVARVEAAVSDVKDDHRITQGLGRLECLRSEREALKAGLPCWVLLQGVAR